jgi:hypothetical protein
MIPLIPLRRTGGNTDAVGVAHTYYLDEEPATICQRPSCLSHTRMNLSVPVS